MAGLGAEHVVWLDVTMRHADLSKARPKRVCSRPGLAEGLLAEGALPAPALCGLGPASPGFEPAKAYLVQVEP